jgi:CRP-like cAMP-binding protein
VNQPLYAGAQNVVKLEPFLASIQTSLGNITKFSGANLTGVFVMSTDTKSFLLSDRREVPTSSIASRNELLSELLRIPGIAASLLPELRIVPLTVNQVLYEQGDKIDIAYFPLDCVVSGLAIMEDGTTLETQMVGREGLVGISAVLGGGLSRHWIWVTIGGNAIQLDAALLDKLFVQSETSLKGLLRFYRSLITQVSQRCVCNTRHTILERLCCWLLMIDDRVGSQKLSLTQEMIASRVGARRAGITVAAGMLQSMGAIEYRRGQLHIAQREVLERAVCECYGSIQGEFNIPPPPLFNLLAINK